MQGFPKFLCCFPLIPPVLCFYALYICIDLAELLKYCLFFQSTDKYAEFDLNDQGDIGKCVCASVVKSEF